MERLLSHRTGKKLVESNISAWRRTVCSDLSSVFRPYNGERIPAPKPVVKNQQLESIHRAKNLDVPGGYKQLTKEDIERVKHDPVASGFLPAQEKGTRPSCALPYELYAELDPYDQNVGVRLNLRVDKLVFGEASAGSPFFVCVHGKQHEARNYAVAAGDQLTDSFPQTLFEDGKYDIRVHGPNGFYRGFTGSRPVPVVFNMDYEFGADEKPTGRLLLRTVNTDDAKGYKIQVRDNAYGAKPLTRDIGAAGSEDGMPSILLGTRGQSGWYDYSILIAGMDDFEKRYAGRVETGKDSISDPAMG
jgi:phospholipase C